MNGNGNSMAVDGAGRLYVTSGAGVQVFSPEGKFLGLIPTPRNVVAAAFAGPDKKLLHVVGSGALAPNGKEFALAEGFRNNGKTIYKIPDVGPGLSRPPKVVRFLAPPSAKAARTAARSGKVGGELRARSHGSLARVSSDRTRAKSPDYVACFYFCHSGNYSAQSLSVSSRTSI